MKTESAKTQEKKLETLEEVTVSVLNENNWWGADKSDPSFKESISNCLYKLRDLYRGFDGKENDPFIVEIRKDIKECNDMVKKVILKYDAIKTAIDSQQAKIRVLEDPKFQVEIENFKKRFMTAIKNGATADDLLHLRSSFEDVIRKNFGMSDRSDIPHSLADQIAYEVGGEKYKKAEEDWWANI